jgi:CO/xanthine dehydrogenase FAD-binding subunit
MKPPPFEYYDPAALPEALELMGVHGADGKVLAGGQSLVPLLNFRIVRPSCLIDINRLDELDYIRVDESGSVILGALTRLATLERSASAAAGLPLLVEAVRHVGHVQVRNRATVGGSVAHADPAAELPAALVALDARFHVESRRATRVVGFDDFFAGVFTTALAPDELLTAVEIPASPPSTGYAFCEFARRQGDFALGGAAVSLTIDARRSCERATIGLLAASATPMRARAAEAFLTGRRLDDAAAREAAGLAVRDAEPADDIHGTAEYRRRVLQEVVRRALLRAAERAESVL